MKVCRICLCQSQDGKLYHISSNGLRALYQQLTGILGATEKILPQWVCAECGLRLMSYNKLRQKSLRACQILSQLVEKGTQITLKEINQIDREQHGLESNLSYTDSFPLRVYNRQEYIEDVAEKPRKINVYEKKIPQTTKGILECIEHRETVEATHEDEYVENVQHRQEYIENVKHEEGYVENVQFDQEYVQCDQEYVQCDQEYVEHDQEICQDGEECFEYIPETLSDVSMIPDTMATDQKVPPQIQEFTFNIEGEKIKTHDSFIENLSDTEVYHEELEANSDLENDFTSLAKLESGSKLDVVVTTDPKANTKSNDIIHEITSEEMNSIQQQHLKNNQRGRREEKMDISDVFSVIKLSPGEQIVEFERRKFSKKYRMALFKCTDCFRGFMNQDVFDRHRLFHSDKWGKYECGMCKMRFRIRSSYYLHRYNHIYKYQCKLCPLVSSQRSSALQHRLKHIGKTYQCPHCPKQFTAQSTFSTHIKVKHVSAEFACELCGHSFISALGLNRHKHIKHAGSIDVAVVASPDCRTCPSCDIMFASDKALQTHMYLAHTSSDGEIEIDPIVKSVICELCGVVSMNGKAHRGHMRSHTNTHACHHCGLTLPTRAKLDEHMFVHGPKPYQCEVCAINFKTKQNYQLHFNTKHAPTRKVYPCDICGKYLTSAQNRNRHRNIHSDLRPYACEHCDKCFKNKGEARAHIMHVHMKVPRPWRRERHRPRY